LSRRWLGAICLAALLPQGAMAQAPAPRAEATAFCLGVVWSAGQVFAMRPPLFMTRVDADLAIVMPDARARALALTVDRDRLAGTLEPEAQAALRQAGSATLLRLLGEGGFEDPGYRALRDACRDLGAALHGTDPAAVEAAFATAQTMVTRYQD
jgi:hypothetical protein